MFENDNEFEDNYKTTAAYLFTDDEDDDKDDDPEKPAPFQYRFVLSDYASKKSEILGNFASVRKAIFFGRKNDKTGEGHECIYGRCVPYYDFDLVRTYDDEETFNKVDSELLKTCRDDIMALYKDYKETIQINILKGSGIIGSKEDKNIYKHSFHFIIRGCGYLNQSSDCVLLDNKGRYENNGGWDANPYKDAGKRQCFRMPFCNKRGDKSRILKPIKYKHDTLKDMKDINENLFIQNISTEEEPCKLIREKPVKDIMQRTNIKTNTMYTNNNKTSTDSKMTIEDIEDLMKCINIADKMDDYATWTRFIWGLGNVARMFELDLFEMADEFSRVSPNYGGEDKVEKLYNDDRERENPITIATFRYMAKKDNPELYEIWRKRFYRKSAQVKYNQFNFNDNYDFTAFRNEFNEREFNSYVDLNNAIYHKCRQVLAATTRGKGLFIKKCNKIFHDITLEKLSKTSNFCMLYRINGKLMPISISDYILKQNCFSAPECDMEGKIDESLFNLWTGFQAVKVEKPESEYSEGFKIMKDFIFEVWANSNEEHYKYIISWFANCITNLSDKTNIAMALISEEGCGKNLLYDFMKYIIRPSNCLMANGIKDITGTFNKQLLNKRLVLINELCSAKEDFRANFDKMKSYITDKTLNIEPKGVDKYEVQNIGNYLLFTNHRDSIIVGKRDRRYAIFELNPRYIDNKAYYNRICEKCYNQETANEFYTYLLSFEQVSLKNIPETEIKKELKMLSKTSAAKFIDHLRDDVIYEKGAIVNASIIYDEYVIWCGKNGEKNIMTSTKFGLSVSEEIIKKRTASGMTYTF